MMINKIKNYFIKIFFIINQFTFPIRVILSLVGIIKYTAEISSTGSRSDFNDLLK